MGPGQRGAGGPSTQFFYPDAGGIYLTDEERESAGKATPTAVRGRKRDIPGEEAYVEIRGPATTGNRSSVPYQKVLPSYKKRAEEAVNRQQIPPEHQQRVRKYFESLQGGS